MPRPTFFSQAISLMFHSPKRRFLLATTFGALAIRLALILFVSDPQAIMQDPVHTKLYEHGEIAHNLYTGHGFAMQWPYVSSDSVRRAVMAQPPKFEGAFLPPLNPYLLVGFYYLFGESATALYAMMLLTAIVGALTVIPIYRLSLLLGGERAARFAALMYLLFLPAAYATITFSGSTLYQFLGVVVLYFCVQVALKGSWRSVVWLGITSGIMTTLRSEFFFFGFVLIALSLAINAISTKRIMVRKAIVSMALCAAIIAPWTYRNYALFHQFVPVLSHPWYELWRGNNWRATGATRDDSGRAIWINANEYPELVRRMDSIPYDQFFEAKVDHVFKDAVIQFAKDDPGRFIQLSAVKILYFFTIEPHYPSTKNPLYFLPMIGVVTLTMVGLFRLWRTPHMQWIAALFSLFLAAYIFMTAMTVALPRYEIYVFTSLLPMTGLAFSRPRFTSEKAVDRTALKKVTATT